MNKIFFIPGLMLVLKTTAQTVIPQTVNVSGYSASSANIRLDWSVGEMTAITTLSGSNKILTQGLLQPLPSPVNSPLPLTWLYFKARLENGQTNLEWKTVQEINNDYFDMERSANGSIFSFFKKMVGKGNSSIPQIYNMTDPSPFKDITYYRLKQVDKDGEFTYSNIVSVKSDNTLIKIFPNPVSEILILEIKDNSIGPLNFEITDAGGRIVILGIGKPNTITQKIYVKNLLPGIYFIKIQNGRLNYLNRFVKL